jgi:hypothetical protein
MHPLYSPDLAPADFFLYPTVKTALKRRFQDVDDIKKNVMDELNTLFLWRPLLTVFKNFLNNTTNSARQDFW